MLSGMLAGLLWIRLFSEGFDGRDVFDPREWDAIPEDHPTIDVRVIDR